MKTKAKGYNNPKITVESITKELDEFLREEEKPIEPERFYEEVYHTRDIFIQNQIRNNY